MILKKVLLYAGAALLLLSTLHAETAQGRGATFPNPVYKAWSADYFKATRNRISYIPTDSEDGINAIIKRSVDFAGSDEPLSPKALEEHKLFVFPTVVGAIAVVYNLEGVGDGELKLSREALAGIFEGKVTFWDDSVIAKDNASLKLPHLPIKVAVRSDGSGTTYNFTYFLHRIDPAFPVSQKPSWQIEKPLEAASNAEMWVQIRESKNTIGYIEYSYKKRLHMTAAQVENRAGNFVKANLTSIEEALKHARWSQENYYYTEITDPDGAASYPIIASTFLFIPREKRPANSTVIAFLGWAYSHGDKKAIALGYAPLPAEIKAKIKAFWKSQGWE